ncbi:site-specific integrase [Fictibacillus enclensis]|uniref:site-specific integrase n=1 Tax=Fictibacillus enclensis TaxID=1017270 RepID=UPI0024BF5D65|nr:site-specific integrase [Fictibacillus enclensis]WHY72639.1 site-specific integrase [Fictibacillus enclensis]
MTIEKKHVFFRRVSTAGQELTLQQEADLRYREALTENQILIIDETSAQKGLDLDYLIFLTLSYTGMRAGELVALKWKDIDFDEHTISITKTYYNPTNNTLEYQLVTRKSKRTIVVDKEVIAALKKHMLVQKKVQEHFGEAYLDEGFIFAKKEKQPGYPIFVKTVENRMARLLKLAGLNSELTPHSLRHAHTSLLAEAKVGLEELGGDYGSVRTL